MTKEMKAIIDKVDKNWDKDIIIRYLLVNLAPFFKKDINFYLRSEEEQLSILKKGITYNNDGLVVCLTLSIFYQELFKYFGIESEVVKANNKTIPLYGLIVSGTHHKYFIDPLHDLFPSQFGIKNWCYGNIPTISGYTLTEEHPYLQALDNSYVDYLDNMIKRFPNNITTDDFFNMLKKDFFIRNKIKTYFGVTKWNQFIMANHKINFISNECINIGQVSGLIERHKMYNYILGMLFEGCERGNIKIHIFRDYDDNGNPINPELIILVDNKQTDEHAMWKEEYQNGIYTLKRKK